MKNWGKSEKSCYKGGYKRGIFYRKWEEEFAVGEAICPVDAIYFHGKCDICAMHKRYVFQRKTQAVCFARIG